MASTVVLTSLGSSTYYPSRIVRLGPSLVAALVEPILSSLCGVRLPPELCGLCGLLTAMHKLPLHPMPRDERLS